MNAVRRIAGHAGDRLLFLSILVCFFSFGVHLSHAQGTTIRTGARQVDDGGGPVRIISVYGPTTLPAGVSANYRARVADGAARPIIYRWQMGDGTRGEGNNVAHVFERPGRYAVIATARNRRGSDSDTLYVTVVERKKPAATDVAGVSRDADSPSVPEAEGDVIKSKPSPSTPASPLRGRAPIDWQKGGYTLIAATASEHGAAELAAQQYRGQGLRTGIYLDDGLGSPAYRVIVGQFETAEEAVAARKALLREGRKGAFLVDPLPMRGGE
jgi:hypothetical protein